MKIQWNRRRVLTALSAVTDDYYSDPSYLCITGSSETKQKKRSERLKRRRKSKS